MIFFIYIYIFICSKLFFILFKQIEVSCTINTIELKTIQKFWNCEIENIKLIIESNEYVGKIRRIHRVYTEIDFTMLLFYGNAIRHSA